VLGSKAIGEPPFIYGIAGFFAIADAVRAANPNAELLPPATPEHVLAALGPLR
jgi:xanthine dehydrogenase large subunit